MEFRDYLLRGEEAAGGREKLADALEQKANAITDAKGNRRGLPVYACITLSKLIGADPLEVIAASELVTEKREDRKAIFRPFVQMGRLSHPMIAPFATILTALTLAIGNSTSTIGSFLL